MNRLAHEPGLYLRQHATHPVHWQPWGEAAFAEAAATGKPVLVSVGYSSCHWCHVMAHESFADPYIADLMNRHFVCVKVDREERPDVDKQMMDAVTMITGRGGWPLNAFCLPDGRPFFGGTYFPAKDTGRGLIPWPQLLMRVADFWKKNRAELESNANAIAQNLLFQNTPEGAADSPLPHRALVDAAKAVCALHDDKRGGFGEAPKFPAPMSLRFLFALRDDPVCADQPALATRLDRVTAHTLRAMACGGIFDQLGGGFARYSVDADWVIPHFEKMLSDNGLLLGAYADGWLRHRDPLFRAVVEETLAWLERDMRVGPAYAAALDADTGHHEGATYVWTPAQIAAELGETDAKRFCAAYAIDERGNFEKNTSNPVYAAGDFALREQLRPLRETLLAARARRPQPARDGKLLLGWNALTLAGLARAAWALDRPDLIRRAADLSDHLHAAFLDPDSGRWRAVVYPESTAAAADAAPRATLADLAWLACAELDLAAIAEWAAPGRAATHLARARRLADTLFQNFADPAGAPGFFLAAPDAHCPVAVRQKDWWDNATPAGNSALAHLCAALSALDCDPRAADTLAALRRAYAGLATRAPHGVAHALTAFVHADAGLAVIHFAPGVDLARVRARLVDSDRPTRLVFLRPDDTLPAGRLRICLGDRCLAEMDADTTADYFA